MEQDLIIIGGGAAGFFLAANLPKNKFHKSLILEQNKDVLSKVKISGGGRCNVTHACFDPKELVQFYPRGSKELLGVFYQFQPKDTFEWFESRGVPLKTEQDNRVFPKTNQSQSIVDCLQKSAIDNGIEIRTQVTVLDISVPDESKDYFEISTNQGNFTTEKLVVATGSSPKMLEILGKLGVKTVPQLPSLFTFKCEDERIKDLQGTSFENVEVQVVDQKLKETGHLLITHWGFSGPAILKTSAWGAKKLAENHYQFQLKINFLGLKKEEVYKNFQSFLKQHISQNISSQVPFSLTKRFWKTLLQYLNIHADTPYSNLSKKNVQLIIDELTEGLYSIDGKSTFKEEFVSAGGVDLKEINFKTMESKKIPNLYLAGEILNIDALTGGFNFQAAWSEAFIISQNI